MPTPAKPIEQLKANGTFKARPLAKSIAPSGVAFKRITSLGDPPEHFGEPGKKLWKEFGDELIAQKILQLPDRFSFTLLCNLYDRVTRAYQLGHEVLASDVSSLQRLFAEFGASPASRRRVAANDTNAPTNPFDEFIAKQ